MVVWLMLRQLSWKYCGFPNADVAPTILEILRIPQPEEMTGTSLIESAVYETKPNRTPIRISR